MTLTTSTALITLGMFLWPVVRWAGQHWKWVMLSLIPLVGALHGCLRPGGRAQESFHHFGSGGQRGQASLCFASYRQQALRESRWSWASPLEF